jgi:polysaccharide export outer membrane protein
MKISDDRRTSGFLSAMGAVALMLLPAPLAHGQVAPPLGQQQAGPRPEAPAVTPSVRPDYVLGPNDQLMIRAPLADDINERPFRVDSDGFLTLPTYGRVQAGGLTVQALEGELVRILSATIRNPSVSITMVVFRNEVVNIQGEFRTPGIYPLNGQTLAEMLSAVGGLLPTASRRIQVTRLLERGPIPLADAVVDPEKKTSTIEISLQKLTSSINPVEDIKLEPNDFIFAGRAERVYVNGEVVKPSAIEMGQRDTMSVLQALVEAGGLGPSAARDRVTVLRPVKGTTRRAEFVIDLKRVQEGKDNDFPLLPNDILTVARDGRRAFWTPVATGVITSSPYLIISLAAAGHL